LTSNLLCIFETYQTFFTGLVGFAGVIITMVLNAKHQIKLQNRQTQHDARALRVALKSELVANKSIYENRIQQLNEPSDFRHTLIPSNVVDGVFKMLKDKIGLLSEEELEVIFKAYLLIAELPYRIRILIGTDNVGGLNDEFLRVDQERREAVTSIHKSFLPDIDNAISIIDEHLSRHENI